MRIKLLGQLLHIHSKDVPEPGSVFTFRMRIDQNQVVEISHSFEALCDFYIQKLNNFQKASKLVFMYKLPNTLRAGLPIYHTYNSAYNQPFSVALPTP